MTEFVLNRYEDPSNVSGTGAVAWGVEWPDGSVAVRWPGDHPSTAAWGDIRDVEAIHGHSGKTLVEYTDPSRLLAAYARVMPYLLDNTGGAIAAVEPHPDHPDRLRITLASEGQWRFWVALLEGSTYAATHEQVDGLLVTTWVAPDGDVWLQYTRRGTFEDLLADERYEHPLTTFDREDRG